MPIEARADENPSRQPSAAGQPPVVIGLSRLQGSTDNDDGQRREDGCFHDFSLLSSQQPLVQTDSVWTEFGTILGP